MFYDEIDHQEIQAQQQAIEEEQAAELAAWEREQGKV